MEPPPPPHAPLPEDDPLHHHLLHEQIAALQRELQARDESVFDLQATLATVEAETLAQTQQTRTRVALLQEQLRRAQHEANRARAAAQQQQQVQKSPPAAAVESSTHQPKQPAAWPQVGGSAAAATLPQQQQQPQFLVPPAPPSDNQPPIVFHTSEPSAGQRLARQLLLGSFVVGGCSSSSSTEQEAQDAKLRSTLARIVSSSAAVVSELDVIWWLMLELRATAAAATPWSATEGNNDEPQDAMQVEENGDPENATATAANENKETRKTTSSTAAAKPNPSTSNNHNPAPPRSRSNSGSPKMLLLLHWLHDALSFSPGVCEFLGKAMTDDDDDDPPQHPVSKSGQRRRPRASGLRILSDQQPNNRLLLQLTERELQNPLWSSSSSSSAPLSTPHDLEPTPLQQRGIRRFWQLCQSLCLFQNDGAERTMEHSIAALRLLQQLDGLQSHADGDFVDGLLSTWTTVVAEVLLLLRQKQQQQRVTNNVSSKNRGGGTGSTSRSSSSSDAASAAPYRLLQQTYVGRGSEDEPASTTDDRDEETLRRIHNVVVESTSSSQLQHEDAVPLLLLNWLAEALSLLRRVWIRCPSSSNTSTTTSTRQRWLSTGRAANLLAAALDLVEGLVLPDDDCRYASHPVTTECVLWCQALASQQHNQSLEDRIRNQQSLRLLRTQFATARSTAEWWHYAPSAVSVTVQLFHKVTIQQHLEDHLPASPVAQAALALQPVRDHLIRFFHAVLQAVQEDRRQWEREQQQQEEVENSNSSSSSSSKREVVSFMMVLSECQELYTSAAALLLAVPPDKEFNLCVVHPDVQAMLRMQMDELAEDQMEKLVMD